MVRFTERAEESADCKRCGGERLIRRRQPAKGVQMLLFCVTLGAWLVPWAVLEILAGPWRCSECGGRVSHWWKDLKPALPWLIGMVVLMVLFFLFVNP